MPSFFNQGQLCFGQEQTWDMWGAHQTTISGFCGCVCLWACPQHTIGDDITIATLSTNCGKSKGKKKCVAKRILSSQCPVVCTSLTSQTEATNKKWKALQSKLVCEKLLPWRTSCDLLMFRREISHNEACVYLQEIKRIKHWRKLVKGATKPLATVFCCSVFVERSFFYSYVSNECGLISPSTGFWFIPSVIISSPLHIAALTVWMFLLSLQRVIGILTFHFMEDGGISSSLIALFHLRPIRCCFQNGSPCYHSKEMPFINIDV